MLSKALAYSLRLGSSNSLPQLSFNAFSIQKMAEIVARVSDKDLTKLEEGAQNESRIMPRNKSTTQTPSLRQAESLDEEPVQLHPSYVTPLGLILSLRMPHSLRSNGSMC